VLDPAFLKRRWTPDLLATKPRVIVDARTAVWSGSNLTTVPNTGSNGGTSSAVAGTVTKGTAVNGITPLHFDATQQLSFGTQSFGAGKRVFLHIGKYGSSHGTLFGLDWTTNTNSFVVYPRDGESGDVTTYFTDGFGGIGDGDGSYIQSNTGTDGNLHAFAAIITQTDGHDYLDGVERAINGSFQHFGVIPAQSATLYMGDSGPTWGPERLQGDSFWSAIVDDISLADFVRWQGWASWAIAGDGSLVPAGHPHKNMWPMI
jgi:hypothetical protein